MVTGAGVLRGRAPLSPLRPGGERRHRRGALKAYRCSRGWRRRRWRSGSRRATRWVTALGGRGAWPRGCGLRRQDGTLATGTLELTLVADAQSEQTARTDSPPRLRPSSGRRRWRAPRPMRSMRGSHRHRRGDFARGRSPRASMRGSPSERSSRRLTRPRSFHATLAGDLTRAPRARSRCWPSAARGSDRTERTCRSTMPAAQPSWNGPLCSAARVCASCWWPRETWRRSRTPKA